MRKIFLMALLLLIVLPVTATAEDLLIMGLAGEELEVNGEIDGYTKSAWEQEPYQLYLARNEEKLFVHLTVEAEGWISIGFNELGAGMNGANMFLGYFAGEEGVLRNDVGVGRTHSAVEDVPLDDFFVSREDGFTIMEFSYPLQFPEDKGFSLSSLNSGDNITVILAYHSTSDNIRSRHSSRTAVNVEIE